MKLARDQELMYYQITLLSAIVDMPKINISTQWKDFSSKKEITGIS